LNSVLRGDYIKNLSQVVNVTESKSVPLGLRKFETGQHYGFCLSKTTLTFTHGWFRRSLILTGLTRVVIITESKSVSLGWRRFETLPKDIVFFSSEYTLTVTHG
jgi:hypothetical protein